MAKVTPMSPVALIHGKTRKNNKGYFYVTPFGDQKYRERPENYQQQRSPKQLWHTQSFVWAHQQIREIWQNPQARKQVEKDWKDAMRRDENGKLYKEAKGWKYALLQRQWKTEHPFEAWYEAYLQDIATKAAEKTASEQTSDYMLRHQIDILQAQINDLRSRLNNH